MAHDTQIICHEAGETQTGDQWYVACSCGWCSQLYPYYYQAVAGGYAHRPLNLRTLLYGCPATYHLPVLIYPLDQHKWVVEYNSGESRMSVYGEDSAIPLAKRLMAQDTRGE